MAKDLRLLYADAANACRLRYLEKYPDADTDTYARAFSEGWGAALFVGLAGPSDPEPSHDMLQTMINQENMALLNLATSIKKMAISGTTKLQLGEFVFRWLKENYPTKEGGISH